MSGEEDWIRLEATMWEDMGSEVYVGFISWENLWIFISPCIYARK